MDMNDRNNLLKNENFNIDEVSMYGTNRYDDRSYNFDNRYDRQYDRRYDNRYDIQYDNRYDRRYDRRYDNRYDRQYDRYYHYPYCDRNGRCDNNLWWLFWPFFFL